MVVHYLRIVHIAIVPSKADTPLVIDSDAELTGAAAAELLEPIVWRQAKILQGSCVVQHPEFAPNTILNVWRETPGLPAAPDIFRRLGCKGTDHI